MRYFILVFICQISLVIGLQSQSQTDTLIVGFYESPPFIERNENGELEGISIWIWERIAADLNLNYHLEEMPLNAILDSLASGGIDLSMNPLTVTSERSQVIDFSHPYFVSNSTVVINQVSTLQKGLQFLSSFFSLNFFRAVFALFLVILIFGLLVWLFERHKNPEEFQPGLRGIWSGIWWSAVTMTTVGYGDKSPQSVGGRVIALVWMFAAIIIISGFTASIASSLTVNQLGWNQNSIEAFKENPIGTVQASATHDWLKKNFYKEVKTYPSVAEGIEALEQEKIEAFVYDEPLMKYLISQEEAGAFQALPIQFNLQFYSFGFTETVDNDLKEQISNQIIELTESVEWEILLAEYDLSVI